MQVCLEEIKGKPFSTTGMMLQSSDGLARLCHERMNIFVVCFGKAGCVKLAFGSEIASLTDQLFKSEMETVYFQLQQIKELNFSVCHPSLFYFNHVFTLPHIINKALYGILWIYHVSKWLTT